MISKSPGTLLIRADASREMGTGHVMRCLALAQAWQDKGGNAIFAMAETIPAIRTRLARESFEQAHISAKSGSMGDADLLSEVSSTSNAQWIVVDGHSFGSDYVARLKCHGKKLLVIDDFGTSEHYVADCILNQNFGATEAQYAGRTGGACLLLGPDYALLRREFRSWLGWSRPVCSSTSGLLLTLGGSDPSGLTARVLEHGGISGFSMKIVLGGGTRPFLVPPGNREVEVVANPGDMAKVLANSDISVICAGGTLWECLFMQCATLSYAHDEFQQSILERLQSQGLVRYLGRVKSFDPQTLVEAVRKIASSERHRSEMAAGGRRLVDGRGVERVLQAMQ